MDFLSIEQLKKLDINSASEYCDFLRRYLIENIGDGGGHLASNLGAAEISVALIRMFDSPNDKIIYDVGHQSYIHKLLTGRIFDKDTLRSFDGYSGFTKRDESEHDPFGAGHSSTALSAALGFSRVSRLNGENNYSVAVVGDGAFCTGMTFEALNNLKKNDKVIIVLNDNEMSISKNVGAMSEYLNKIRVTQKYLSFKRKTKSAFGKIPLVYNFVHMVKRIAKRVLIKPTFFEDLGIYYLGPADGNDLNTVETLLAEAKSRNSPVLIHLVTKKGKGLKEAEENPGKYHFVSPKSVMERTFSEEYTRLLIEYSRENKNAVAITAAMCDGTGLSQYKKEFPDRLFDVGISEEHAATFTAALSAGGLLPFYTVYSTFFQRSYDQVLHDIALQKLKTIITLDRAGLVGADGATHHGLFDVSMMLNVPDTSIYSPATFAELKYAFDKCVEYQYTSVLRYPKACDSKLISSVFTSVGDFQLDSVEHSDIVIVTYGRITEEVLKAKLLLKLKGYSVSVLKFVKLKPLDFKKIELLINSINPKLLCVVEEGMKTGGFGQYLICNVDINAKTDIIAIDETFVPHGTLNELYDFCSLSGEKISERILKCL